MLLDPEGCARLVLLRHPRLEEEDRARALGRGDAKLSRRGRAHVLRLIEALERVKIDRIACPPAAHCRETARALAERLSVPLVEDERLLDQHMGDWEGRGWREIHVTDGERLRRFFQDYGKVAPPGGESLAEAVERVLSWWREIAPEQQGQSLMLVGSGQVLQGLAARLVGLPLIRAPALSLPDGAFGILDVYDDGAVVRAWHPLALDDAVP